jgi:DNA-binding MarR family transcriptional regulator
MTSADSRTPWLDTEQQRTWRAYLVGSTLLLSRLDRELRDEHGLSLPEYEILVRLSESPQHRLRMAMLAGAMSHSRSRVTHTVNRLERAGLVDRDSCLEDGRGVEAVLTDKGYETLRQAAPTHVRGVRELFVELATPEDFAAVGRVFSSVADRLNDDNPTVGLIRRGAEPA